MQVDDLRLLGIPRSRSIIPMVYPQHDGYSKDSPDLSVKVTNVQLDEPISVARVRPRTSKGITDLLLPRTSIGYTPIVPLRSTNRLEHECSSALVSRSRSRSLTELTRQITPPTKNGHAPPPIESRKIFNLSILTMSGPGKFSRVESN